MKKVIRILSVLAAIYILTCSLLFFFQEKLIFFPEKLDKDFKFSFDQKFEELFIKTSDNKLLNGLLFKSDSSRGLIFYLHGNAGSLDSWGEVSKIYTDLHYDVFMLDYRGYGKSEGFINGQNQLFRDLQTVYNELKKKYSEDRIIVLGYSIGTGLATELSSKNHPKLLILQAPYYSLKDLVEHNYPVIPTFLLKYKLETNNYLRGCKMPVIIFHGNADQVIYYNSSLRLKEFFKKSDTLITLDRQGHNGMTDNPEYRQYIKDVLSR